MRNMRFWIILLLFFSLLSIQLNYESTKRISVGFGNSNISLKTTQTEIYKTEIEVTAPSGYSLKEKTPIIIKLSTLAEAFPASSDPFGKNTVDTSDDVKWPAAYVTYGDDLIPSQVDDVDNQIGYSEDDELLFQLPESLELASGESATFSAYFGTQETNLPEPLFSEDCTVYEYTKYAEVKKNFGADMLKEAYYIDNRKIQAAALVDSAWSSGGLYELSVLDEQGNSQWDAIKQRFDSSWESWKWARFATVEQFIELNDKAGTNNFFIPDSQRSIIRGPVRARITMQSIPPYGKASSVWGTKPGVFGLVTYDLYANLPYLDYTLDITGPNAAENPTLIIELQNREKAAGGSYSPYKSIYVPGKGWRPRNPDDLDDHAILSSEFLESWYLEKLAPGETMFPEEPNADKLGYGTIFDITGLTNITYRKGSEELKLKYDACNFPLHARYFPLDASITEDAIAFMEEQYLEWSRPSPEFDVTITSVTELPFEYVGVTRPEILYDNDTALLQIENVTAMSTKYGAINDSIEATHTYEVLLAKTKAETTITGDLTWNSTTETWETHDVSLASLSPDVAYVVVVYFEVDSILGTSPPSIPFPEIPDSDPPIIGSPTQMPGANATIHSSDMVNVSVRVTDDSPLSKVILSYNNGTWHNLTMTSAFGLYSASIPPQAEGASIEYKIIAYDVAGNFNSSEIYSYQVAVGYHAGQGLIPFVGAAGILIAAIVIALKTTGLHRQKYDQVE
ncbi:MAG: hypothetical protein JSV04_12495 [Candidatus Heimdallarchaeota archaeon]|nr:MAG: hypothetical protein JSV04_12495 [Candidatus Heimdallarchaeota archaeon]